MRIGQCSECSNRKRLTHPHPVTPEKGDVCVACYERLAEMVTVPSTASSAEDSVTKCLDSLIEDIEDGFLAEKAILEIGKIGPAAVAAVPVLIAAARAKRASKRKSAIWALRRIGVGALAAVPALLKVLRDPRAAVRADAAWALAKIAPTDEIVVRAIGDCLADPNESVRNQAACALIESGASAEAALPAVRRSLGDDSVRVRKNLVTVLENIGRAIATSLLEATADPDNDVKQAAVDALAKIGPPQQTTEL